LSPVHSWGVIKHGVPHESITNNKNNNNISKLILFADDTSMTVTYPNHTDFIKDINTIFKNINEEFKLIYYHWIFIKLTK
jgi:hypothetical protein